MHKIQLDLAHYTSYYAIIFGANMLGFQKNSHSTSLFNMDKTVNLLFCLFMRLCLLNLRVLSCP